MITYAHTTDDIVDRVIVLPAAQEIRGAEYLEVDLGLSGPWIQTWEDGSRRGRYAAPGMRYDVEKDVFHDAQPHPSWLLNETGDWQSPVPYPADVVEGLLEWSEEELSWIERSDA